MTKAAKFSLTVLVLVGLAAALFLLPIREWTISLIAWVRLLGPAGAAVYAAVYMLAPVVMFPASLLTLAAGFLYGPWWGTLLVSPASVVGATLAFLLGRTAGRERVARKIENDPRFSAIDAAVGKNGLKIIFLLRLSPVFPFTLLNYALGVTRVRLRDYILGSFLGMLPGTFLYVYLGSSVANLAALASGKAASAGLAGRLFFLGGLAATILVVVLVTRTARQVLDRSLHDASVSRAAAGDRS